MPNGSIIAFDICILLRLARLDMLDRDVAALGPFQKLLLTYSGPLSTRMLAGLPRNSMI